MYTNICSTYFTEFYKQAVYHFVVSIGCAALFALGLHYTQGSNGDKNIPYFIPAIVLSTMHFMATIGALLSYYFARSLSDIYDTLRRWDNSEKHFRRLKGFYLILQYISFIWSIVGASIAGNSGICSNKENPCYYTVNKWENRTIAIVIVILHVSNAIITFIIIKTRHKIRPENDSTSMNIKRKRTDSIQNLKLSPKPPNFHLKLNTSGSRAHTDNSSTYPSMKNPEQVRKISIISHGLKSDKNKEEKRNNVLPPIKEPLKRYHTVHGSPTNTPDDNDRDNIVTKEKINRKSSHKRLSPKCKIKLLKNRDTSVIQARQQTLDSCVDNPSEYSNESSRIKRSSNKIENHVKVNRRMSQLPNLPPPSYNQIIETRDTIPYWIPPEPQNDERLHYLPENMYSVNSYPETDLIPVKPVMLTKRINE